MLGAADQQAQRRAHGAEVGAEIDHIGDEQQEHDRAQEPRRVVTAEVVGDAVAGHAADPRADRLDHGHQRKAEQHGPGEAVAELGADLAVGGDAARIVVRRAGHQTRAQLLQKSDRLERHFLRGLRSGRFCLGRRAHRVRNCRFSRRFI